jgi:hypothetical protein
LTKFFFIVFFATALVSGISSCSKDPAPAPDLGYNYFPDKAGSYIVYNVDSVAYNAHAYSYPAIRDTFRFQLKEKIQSVYTDNEGRATLRLERYIKRYNPSVPYSLMNWTLRNVWAENRTARAAEKVEENVRFVKLAFPVKEGQEWNGNAQNTMQAENFSYAFFDITRTIGNIRFDSVLQVDQYNELDLVHQKYYEEKYARNVGLIYKRVIDIQSQPPDWSMDPFMNDSLTLFFGNPILKRASAGSQYTLTISTFGTE